MTARLTGVRGPLTGRAFELSDQPLTIGRAADNHVAIASPRASRHHAHIRREGAVFVIYDLGSANGTLVNGQRVQRAVLQPGDLIDVGDEVFRFEAAYQQDATVLGAPAAPAQAYPSQPPASQPPYPPISYPPSPAPPTAPAPAATPYPPHPGVPPSAYPPQQSAYPPQPQMSPQPAYPSQQPLQAAYHPPQPQASYPPQMPPAGQAPAYVPPPPRTKSSGRSCLLVVVLLLALVCVAGAAGAFVFRDRLRDFPGIRDLPGIDCLQEPTGYLFQPHRSAPIRAERRP
ncbi:MAG: FHA domain-containing protein [Roseiflexaceae bacterium]|nr:FHA domain-containing protein [Roseiflexus sp.]MDW8212807.1 FHA domain-containing protein [Roseiflexaceae bacterium]